MKAPEFWGRGQGGVASLLLSPVGWMYGLATAARLKVVTAWKAPIPVVCVGNIVAGGAGKTPVAIDIGKRLKSRGKKVHFLTRGYGGNVTGSLLVDPEHHSAKDVGDEALLLTRMAPTWVCRERAEGARHALKAGADVLIMDDGFQNPSLHKDMSLVIVDGGYGFGNGRLVPAGPLRETVSAGLSRADALILIGDDERDVLGTVRAYGTFSLGARLEVDDSVSDLRNERIIAFAGIGRPQKFFNTLAETGCETVATHAFPDHHPFSDSDLKRLQDEARENDAMLVTTEKDAVRLPAGFKDDVTVVSVSVTWNEESGIESLLDQLLEEDRGSRCS